MKAVKKAILLIVILLVVSGTISCRDNSSSNVESENTENQGGKKITIGVSPLTLRLEYYAGYAQSIRKSANKFDVKIIIEDSMWNVGKQESDIENFISEKVDAIICSPVDPEGIKPLLIKAESAGIPIVVEMTKVQGVNPLVCTDQEKGGELAGRYAGEWINKRYKGVCETAIIDFPYLQNIIDRVSGFEKGLAETAPNAKIVMKIDGKAKMETAVKAMEDILKDYPNVRCVFGINDDSAKGANEAFEILNFTTEDVCILGFDADNGAKKLINGHRYLKGSVMADTDKIADACIDTAIKKIKKSEALPEWINVKDAQYLITQENVSKYYK